MTSPEKGEEWQRRFAFGNRVVPPQEEEQVCLRRSDLQQVPDRLFKNSCLTYLCLEGNHIPSVPSSVFTCWPRLQWLDLRNNHIMALPAEIGSHRCLEMLLLEGNPISELPPELGSVITLRGLNLRDCPIHFPPQHIVQQGYRSILAYLRRVLAERSVSATKTLPVVEKLQLSDLIESSVVEEDEPEDKDGLQRFRELKDQLILLDQADLKLTVNCAKYHRSELLSSSRVKKNKAGILPELQLSHLKRSGEKRTATMKELRENQALLEQRRKSLEALEKWRTEAKKVRMKKMSPRKQRSQETGILEESLEDRSRKSSMFDVTTGNNGDRSARKLERDICACVERIQEKSRNPSSTASEQMAAEAKDVEMIRKLQAQLMQRRRHHEKDLFSGVSWSGFPPE